MLISVLKTNPVSGIINFLLLTFLMNNLELNIAVATKNASRNFLTKYVKDSIGFVRNKWNKKSKIFVTIATISALLNMVIILQLFFHSLKDECCNDSCILLDW